MKTDRELLEGAARAVGIRVKWEDVHACFRIEFGQGLMVEPWNPLDSEAQAAQLAATLKMRTWHSQECACAEYGSSWDNTQHYGSYAMPYAEAGGDVVKAMRRAITGAAAAYEPPKQPASAAEAMARKIDDDIFQSALKANRDAAKEVEARVGGELQRRLNALVHGGPSMLKNDESARRAIADIVREVVDAEVPPPPFEVLVDMTTDQNRVQINFAYPLGVFL